MVVKLYIDFRSQPCRALVIFMKLSKIPFEIELVDLFKGEQKTPEYTEVNALRTVPAMKDGDFCMGECEAIIRYLTSKYPDLVPDHLFPKDLQKRARVNEYLSFHHLGTRRGVAMPFFSAVVYPIFSGKEVSDERRSSELEYMADQLDKMERAFLARNNTWLAGDDLSIADILAACEFAQHIVSGRDVFEGRPQLAAYMKRVEARLNPIFDEVNAKLREWRDSTKK